MAKISAKSSLVLGTNLFLHLADKGGTDLAIASAGTIASVTTDFTSQSSAGGIVNRSIVVGDVLTIGNTAQTANEGVQVQVDAVSANSISFTVVSGSPVDESAGADINLVATRKSYQFVEAGSLNFIDGCQGIVLASKLVDLWADLDLDRYAPPFTSIEPRAKSLASINGWEPHDDATLNAIRDSALEIRATATSAARRIYVLLRTNGNFHAATDQMFVWAVSDPALDPPIQAVMQGYLNQLFLIYDSDAAIDKRGTWAQRCAVPGKTILYGTADIQFAEIVTVPNNNQIDPKLADPGTGTPYTDDSTISAGGIYAHIGYYLDADETYSGDVDGIAYNFRGYIDADGQSNERVHEAINYLWRQGVNINQDGTGALLRGDKQPPITLFSGDTFSVEGYLLNYNIAQRNNLRVIDNVGTTRQWPLVNSITVNAPAIAHGGTFSVYHANTFGTSSAVYFQDSSGTDQQDITIAASVPILFAYSSYAVDGHAPNTPLEVIVAFSRPGFIEAGFTDSITLAGNDVPIQLSPIADPSYIAV